METSPETVSEPPLAVSPTNEHDEDADVLDVSGVDMAGFLGDGWETRRGHHARRSTFGQGVGVEQRGGSAAGGMSKEDVFSDEVRRR